MKTLKYIAIGVLMVCAASAGAQTLKTAYYTKDMKMRHTLNPAFANEQSYVSIPALGNITVNTHGNFGLRDVLFDNPLYGTNSSDKLTTFMNPYYDDATALAGFATGNNRVVADVNIAIVSVGFKAFKGYNTIEINSRTNVGISVPYELFSFARNVGNKTYDIGEINAHAQSFVELAFGHSRDLDEHWRVGAKVKFLFGAGRADLTMKNMKADLADANKWIISGEAQGDLSFKGAYFVSKTRSYSQTDQEYETIDKLKVSGGGLGGFGVGFDLGTEFKLNENWKFNAALLDLGFISWSNDVQVRNATSSVIFDGFHDVSVSKQRDPNTLGYQAKGYADQFKDFANLQDKGDQGSRTTGIGATLNLGAEYTLPKYNKMSFGFLSSTHINGPHSWTEGRMSANWSPLKCLDGGVSFAINSFTASLGWIVNVHPKGYNFFIGMDHILGKTTKEVIPLSSNASVSLGMSITW